MARMLSLGKDGGWGVRPTGEGKLRRSIRREAACAGQRHQSAGARKETCMAAWLPGYTVAWLHAECLPGCTAAWLHSCMAARLRGCTAAWLQGHVAAERGA